MADSQIANDGIPPPDVCPFPLATVKLAQLPMCFHRVNAPVRQDEGVNAPELTTRSFAPVATTFICGQHPILE